MKEKRREESLKKALEFVIKRNVVNLIYSFSAHKNI